jgi:Phage portal protein
MGLRQWWHSRQQTRAQTYLAAHPDLALRALRQDPALGLAAVTAYWDRQVSLHAPGFQLSGAGAQQPDRKTAPWPILTQLGHGARHALTQTLPKATPYNLRRFSEYPPARRAINAITNPLVELAWQIRTIPDPDDPKATPSLEERLQSALVTRCLTTPNDDDSWRTFMESVLEDIVVGGYGAIEVGRSDDPLRPLYLWPVDGQSIRINANWDPAFPDEPRYSQALAYVGMSVGTHDRVELRDDELIYLKLNPRTHTPFGLGYLEVAFSTINAWLGAMEHSERMASNAIPNVAIFLGEHVDLTTARQWRAYWQEQIEGYGSVPILGGGPKPEVMDLRGAGVDQRGVAGVDLGAWGWRGGSPAAGWWAELSRQVVRTALAVRGNALGARGTRRASAGTAELQLAPPAQDLADVAQDRGLALDGLDLGEARPLVPRVHPDLPPQAADAGDEGMEVDHAALLILQGPRPADALAVLVPARPVEGAVHLRHEDPKAPRGRLGVHGAPKGEGTEPLPAPLPQEADPGVLEGAGVDRRSRRVAMAHGGGVSRCAHESLIQGRHVPRKHARERDGPGRDPHHGLHLGLGHARPREGQAARRTGRADLRERRLACPSARLRVIFSQCAAEPAQGPEALAEREARERGELGHLSGSPAQEVWGLEQRAERGAAPRAHVVVAIADSHHPSRPRGGTAPGGGEVGLRPRLLVGREDMDVDVPAGVGMMGDLDAIDAPTDAVPPPGRAPQLGEAAFEAGDDPLHGLVGRGQREGDEHPPIVRIATLQGPQGGQEAIEGPRLPPVRTLGAEAVVTPRPRNGARQVAMLAALRPKRGRAARHPPGPGGEAGLAQEGDEPALDGA